MDHHINQKLQEQRNLTLLVTYSFIPLSLAAAQHATLFSQYLPSLQDKFQRIEQVFHEPGMSVAYLLTASLVYVSGIATLIEEHYNYKIDQLR